MQLDPKQIKGVSVGATGATGVGATGATGPGATGPTGATGVGFPGYPFRFLSATSATDPLIGNFKFNNTTYSSITAIYISYSDANGAGVSPEILTWVTGTQILIRGSTLGGVKFVTLKTNGSIIDHTTWLEIPVTYIASAGLTFGGAEPVYFTPALSSPGATGATGVGATGATGVGATGATGAAGGGGDVTQIFDSELGSAAASFDITSISGSYKNLKLVVSLRADNSSDQAVYITLNNDSGSNYEYIRHYRDTGTADAWGQNASDTKLYMFDAPGAARTAGYCVTGEVTIPNYKGTNFMKGVSCSPMSGFTNVGTQVLGSGMWLSTAAVTRITIKMAVGNIAAGSRVTLYGMN